MRGEAGRRRTRSLRCSPAPRRAQLGPGAALQHLGEAAPEAWRRRRDVAPLAVRGCSGALHKSVEPERSAASADIGIVSTITEMPPGDAPPRCPRAACAHRGALPFPLRLSPHRSVSPWSGPSTSPRRRAWSRRPAARRARRPGTAGCSTCRSGGWRGAAGPATWEMATMMYEPRKDDTRSRSYVRRPFAFLFFFPSPGAERRRLSGGAGAEMCGV